MSTGAQIEADWAALESPRGAGPVGQSAGDGRPAGAKSYPSDEEILGMEALSEAGTTKGPGSDPSSSLRASDPGYSSAPAQTGGSDSLVGTDPHEGVENRLEMPEWLRVSAADPRHAAEVEQLWKEHREFRAAFSSAAEARAIKELFPGGATEARALRQSTLELRQSAQAIDQFDAAIFSGDPRAQSELVTELARTNPAAFRSLFAEAARVLGNIGQIQAPGLQTEPTLRNNREGWGTRNSSGTEVIQPSTGGAPGRGASGLAVDAAGQTTGGTPALHAAPQFDAAAYASFERTTNEVVGRDVRASVTETLSRVLPEGIAEGAARRIGEDVFNEIHRTLASDRTLSEQVGDVLRGWRFGAAEQQRVAALLAGRAKQLVPAVARRVIGEWTGSVLGTARSRDARRAVAASRVDIGTPGGSLDSMPLRPMSAREIHYASMSDEDILGM